MKKILALVIFAFFLPSTGGAETLFSDNWNEQADWNSGQAVSLLTTESGTSGAGWEYVYGNAVAVASDYGKTGKGVRFTIVNSGAETQACNLIGDGNWSFSGTSLFWGFNCKFSQIIPQDVPLKMSRIYSGSNSVIPEFFGDEFVFFYDGMIQDYTVWTLTDTNWHSYVVEFQRGENSSDGVIRLWIDDNLEYEDTAVDWGDTGTSFTSETFPYLMGNMSGSYSSGTFYVYWDDYIWATTKAEVDSFLGLSGNSNHSGGGTGGWQ